jgi:hypothetical protein
MMTSNYVTIMRFFGAIRLGIVLMLSVHIKREQVVI